MVYVFRFILQYRGQAEYEVWINRVQQPERLASKDGKLTWHFGTKPDPELVDAFNAFKLAEHAAAVGKCGAEWVAPFEPWTI